MLSLPARCFAFTWHNVNTNCVSRPEELFFCVNVPDRDKEKEGRLACPLALARMGGVQILEKNRNGKEK
jgi:hypothetical protein